MSPNALVHALVVDDDDVQHLMMIALLEQIGLKHYYLVKSGEEALAKLRAELFHVVLTDNQMPGMTGRDLIAEIRRDPLLRHLKVAMISSDLEVGGPENQDLQDFLWRHNVLAVPKKNLDAAKVARTISTLVRF